MFTKCIVKLKLFKIKMLSQMAKLHTKKQSYQCIIYTGLDLQMLYRVIDQKPDLMEKVMDQYNGNCGLLTID